MCVHGAGPVCTFDRPIACGVDAAPILNYTGGIVTDAGGGIDHIISVIGWGTDPATQSQYVLYES